MIPKSNNHIQNLKKAQLDLEGNGFIVETIDTTLSPFNLLAKKAGANSRKIRVISSCYAARWIKDQMQGNKNLNPQYSVEIWLYADSQEKPSIIIFR